MTHHLWNPYKTPHKQTFNPLDTWSKKDTIKDPFTITNLTSNLDLKHTIHKTLTNPDHRPKLRSKNSDAKPFAKKSQTPKTKPKKKKLKQKPKVKKRKPRSTAFGRFSKETIYKLKKRRPRPFEKIHLCSKTSLEHGDARRCMASSDHRSLERSRSFSL